MKPLPFLYLLMLGVAVLPLNGWAAGSELQVPLHPAAKPSVAWIAHQWVLRIGPEASVFWYWAPAIGVYTILVVWTLFHFIMASRERDSTARAGRPLPFALGITLCLLLFRWPFFSITEQNPDESQAIAGALTLLHDPVPWRSVDGGTHGPLVHYALLLPSLFGLAIDYGSARLIGLGMIIASVLLLYGSLNNLFREEVARVAVLPVVLCFGLFNHFDGIAYNGEHVTIFFLSLSLYFAIKIQKASINNLGVYCFLCSLTLGLVPYTKFQGLPVAFIIMIISYLLISLKSMGNLWIWIKNSFVFAIGITTPTLFLFIVLHYFSLFEDYSRSFIYYNLVYAPIGRLSLSDKLSWFADFALSIPESREFFISQTIILVVGIIWLVLSFKKGKLLSINSLFIVFASLIMTSTIFSVIHPTRSFYHYLLFLYIPLVFLTGSILAAVLDMVEDRRTAILIVSVFLLITVIYPLQSRISDGYDTFVNVISKQYTNYNYAARKILSYASPGESMIVWGWAARYYAETGLYQATRSGTTAGIITVNPQQNYYLKRFMEDMKRSNAPVFVDAVGKRAFAYENREKLIHECFPEVDDFIHKQYQFVADIDGARIYISKRRLRNGLLPPRSRTS